MKARFVRLFTLISLVASSSIFAAGPAGIEAGLRLWLDASDSSTMYTDAACTPGNEVTAKGETVRCWKGKSPQAFEAVAALGAPVWVDDDGLDALEFTSDRMDIEGSTGGAVFDTGTDVSETEVFFVARTRTISNGWAFGYQSGGRRFGSHFPWSDGNVYFDVGQCCGASRIAAPWGGSSSFLHTWNFISDDGVPNYQAIYRDGTLVASDAVADSITWGTTDFRIGAYTTDFQQINAAEFIIFDRRLSDAERDQVRNYLLNKWRQPVEAADGWTSGTNKTITAPSGTDRMLIVATGYEDGTEKTVTSVTYGGQNLTEIAQRSSGTSFFNGTSLWYLNDAGISAAGNTTITINYDNAGINHTDVASAVYTGIDQDNPIFSSIASDDGQSGQPSLTANLDVTEDGLTIVNGQSGNTGTFSTNLTTVISHSGASTSQTVGVQTEASDETGRTVSINHTNGFRMVLAAAHLRSSTLPEVTGLNSVATSDTSILISWNQKASIPNYRIAYQAGSTAPGNCELGTTIDVGAVGSHQLSGLTSATEYSFRVCGNSGATFTNGLTTSAITDTLPPDPPNELLAVNLIINGPDSVTYSWVTGGGGTTGFRLAYTTGGVAPADCISGTQVDLGNTTSNVISGLSALTEYSYRVCAYNGTPLYTTGITGTFTTPGIATTSSNVHLTTNFTTGPARTQFGSAQNRMFVLGVGFENGSDIASIDFGGQAMTRIINRNQGGARSEVWALNEAQIQALTPPLTASVTYTAGAPVGSIYSSVVLGNVDQVTNTSNTNTAGNNTATTDNVTLTHEVGGLSIVQGTTRRNFAVGSVGSPSWNLGIAEANNRLGAIMSYKESTVAAGDNVDINFTLGAAQLSLAAAHFKLADATQPVGLALDSRSDITLNVSWTSGLGTTTGFRIAHQAGATPPADCSAGTDIGNVEIHSITGLTSETEYSIRVCPYNIQGTLSAGITLSATTDKNPLAAPTEISSLNLNVVSSNEISLNWLNGGGTTTSFDIAYLTGATPPANCTLGTVTNTTSMAFAFASLTSNTQYSFRVCSKNADGVLSSGLTATGTTGVSAPPPTVTVSGAWQTGLTRVADAGSSRVLIFAVSSEDTVDADVTAVTYGGQALTHARTSQNSFGVTDYNRVEIWYLLEAGIAAATNTNFDVTWNNGAQNRRYYAHAMISDIDQANPLFDTNDLSFSNGIDPIGTDIDSLNGHISIAAATTSNDGTYSLNNGWAFGSEQSGNSSSLGTGHLVSTSSTTESASLSHTNAGRSSLAVINLRASESAPNEIISLAGSVINSTTLKLDWTSGGGTTSGFRIAYQPGASAPANCFSGTQIDNGSIITRQIGGFTASTQHSFRVCAYNSSGEYSAGLTTTLTTSPPDTNWTGAVDTNWFNAANWDNGVPNSTSNCTIPNVANDPIINAGGAECQNLTIQAPITINGSNSISGFGQITLNGAAAISGTGDFIIADSSAVTQTLTTTTSLNNLKIEKSSGGNLVLISDVEASDLDLTGANFNLVINNGIDFDINNTYAIPTNSTVTVNQGGRIRVPSGDTILVSGGTLRTTGVIDTTLSTNPGYTTSQAHIGTISGTGNFSLQATSGTLDLTGVHIDRLDNNGLQATGSSSIASFNGVHLTNLPSSGSGQSLLINTTGSVPNSASYFGADYVSTAAYNSATGYQIIRAQGTCAPSGNHTLDFLEWYGNFFGGVAGAKVSDNNPICQVTMDLSASPVSLASIDVNPYSDGIVLEWKTTAEVMHRGFNIYRSESINSGFIQINTELILNSIFSTSFAGEYRYIDRGVESGKTYYYILEDIATTNERVQHGPYQASINLTAGTIPNFSDNINQYNGDIDFEESNPVVQNDYLANIAPGVNLYKRPNGNLRLHIKPEAFTSTNSSWNASYKDISIGSYVKLSEEGKPALPFTEILIPLSTQASNITSSIESLDDKVESILPSPAPSYSVVGGVLTPSYSPDATVYSQASYYPQADHTTTDTTSITLNGSHYIKVTVYPHLFKGSTTELKVLDEMYLDINYDEAAPNIASDSQNIKINSLARNGVRIFYKSSGHYKVSFDDLFQNGVESLFDGVEHSKLELTYRGKSLPVHIERINPEVFGPGDYLMFKAPYEKNPYTVLDSVLLSINEDESGLRYIPLSNAINAPIQEISFNKTQSYEIDNSNLFINNRSIGAGIDHYYWSRIYLQSGDSSDPSAARFCQDVKLSGIKGQDIKIQLDAAVFGNLSIVNRTDIEAYFSSDSSNKVELPFYGQTHSSSSADYQLSFTPAETEELCFRIKPFISSGSENYVFDINSFRVDFESDSTQGSFSNLEFATNYRIPYDSTKGPFLLVQNEKEGDSFLYNNIDQDATHLTFTSGGIVSSESEFEIVYTNELQVPQFMAWSEINGSQFDNIAQNELLIITNKDLISEAQRLADHKNANGIDSVVITHQQILDHYSFGLNKPQAVKALLKEINNYSSRRLKYVLFAMDSSIDAKNLEGLEITARSPAYLNTSVFHDYASDLWNIKENGSLYDFAIGRLPVNTNLELRSAVDKIIKYEDEIVSTYSSDIAFLYTDDSVSNFEQASLSYSSAANLFEKSYQNLSNSTAGTLQSEMDEKFLVNFMGHGSEYSLGKNSEFLTLANVNAMTNNDKFPLLVALNCLSNFHASSDPTDLGLGESLVLRENAGAIGVIAANTLLSPGDQSAFATFFYDELNNASKSTNKDLRIGDILKSTHQRLALAGIDNNQTDSIILLGDPSLRMPASVFQEAKPFTASKTSSGGGCSIGGNNTPWYIGLFEILLLIGLLAISRKIKRTV